MNKLAIGNYIKNLRHQNGYTQKQLSTLLHVSDKAISKWERGLSVPDISLITKLSFILGEDIEKILQAYQEETYSDLVGIIFLNYEKGVHASTLLNDKPYVWYALSNLLLLKVSQVIILGSNAELQLAKDLLIKDEALNSCVGIDYVAYENTFTNCNHSNDIINPELYYFIHDYLPSSANAVIADASYIVYGAGFTSYVNTIISRKKTALLFGRENHRNIPFAFLPSNSLDIGFQKHQLQRGVISIKINIENLKPVSDILNFLEKNQNESIGDYRTVLHERHYI